MSKHSALPGVALITGAASGMGRATAIAFANAGCTRLALLDLNAAGLEETNSLLFQNAISSSLATPDVLTIVVNVTQPETITAAFNQVQSHFKRIDYSIQCAGIVALTGPSVMCSLADFDRQTATNYRGLWLCTREAIRIMRDQALDCDAYPDANIPPTRAQRGAVVNISSAIAVYSQASSPAYCGSKAAVLAVTRSDAVDYAVDRVRVNAILPGIVNTPMTNPDPKTRAWLEATPVQRTPMKRFGQPEEVADVAIFLAGTTASFVTGASWAVDGGFIAGY